MRRFRNKFGMTILLLALTSCYTPPDKFPIENAREYDLPYNKVWSNVVEYFAVSNTPIQTIEKDSGIIYAEVDFYKTSHADCGKIGREKIRDAFGLVRYNVFVKKLSETKTKVLVNTRFSNSTVYNPLRTRDQRVECVTTGDLENEVLDFVTNPQLEVIYKFKERK